MPDLTDRACKLAKRLLSENRSGRSWRQIAREDYGDQVHFATLNRIANAAGEWIPRSRKVQLLLGLVERKRRTRIQKAISRMVRQTKKDVLRVKK